MQKNFGSPKKSSNFAADFAPKNEREVKKWSLRNLINDDVVQEKSPTPYIYIIYACRDWENKVPCQNNTI